MKIMQIGLFGDVEFSVIERKHKKGRIRERKMYKNSIL